MLIHLYVATTCQLLAKQEANTCTWSKEGEIGDIFKTNTDHFLPILSQELNFCAQTFTQEEEEGAESQSDPACR